MEDKKLEGLAAIGGMAGMGQQQIDPKIGFFNQLPLLFGPQQYNQLPPFLVITEDIECEIIEPKKLPPCNPSM